MSLPLTFALLGMAAAANNYEWAGVFYTPGAEYKWMAQMTGASAGAKGYVDATMTIALIPATGQSKEALDAVAGTGNEVMAGTASGTCEDVVSGGVLTPDTTKCYNLIFDQTNSDSVFTVDASGTENIAFFCQHFPVEFEDTQHYFKDHTGADVEPGYPVPEEGGHSHSHGGGEDGDEFAGWCVCQAASGGWKVDCSTMTPVTTAVAALKAKAECMAGSPPDDCVKNYFIMQAHHDHCLHDVLPTDIEKDLHVYEEFYQDCFIKRQYDSGLSNCPAVTCGGNEVTTAVSKLNACGTSPTACAQTDCSAAMKTVLMAHDTCPEDTLPDNLEKSLHDHEVFCAAELCNSAEAAFDPYDDPCSAETSGGATRQPAFLVMTLLSCLAACLF